MARRRGFFAELQHQAAVAERNRQRDQASALREAQRSEREADRALAAAERALATAIRTDERAWAKAEREAKRLHVVAQEAHVEALNLDLGTQLAEIDMMLTATLEVDDHVKLEELRQVVERLPFTSPHETALPAPPPIVAPPEPTFVEPPAPTGLGAILGKKKHAAAVDQARAAFAHQHAAWQVQAAAVPMRQLDQLTRHQAIEAERATRLGADRAVYDEECRKRQAAVDAENAQLDDLIRRLSEGEKGAVEEYFGIVFGKSVYPDSVSIDIEHSYRPDDRELEVALRLPHPSDLPRVKGYKYLKAKDEITGTSQTVKEQRDRFNNLVHSVVLRTMHEVWESDRLGHVDTISLTAGVEHIDSATGRPTTTRLVAVAVDRAEFESIGLAHVTPAETLKHLKAVVSKNPHALAGINLASGIRG